MSSPTAWKLPATDGSAANDLLKTTNMWLSIPGIGTAADGLSSVAANSTAVRTYDSTTTADDLPVTTVRISSTIGYDLFADSTTTSGSFMAVKYESTISLATSDTQLSILYMMAHQSQFMNKQLMV